MANKYTRGRRLSRATGEPCPYCRRAMHYDNLLNTFPTIEHPHPRSKGGKQTTYACFDCNQIKGDMTLDEWQKFMAENPRWWDNDREIYSSGGSRGRAKGR